MNLGFRLPLFAASAAVLLAGVSSPAQTPVEPLGELLDVIPLPEKPAADKPAAAEAPRPAPQTPPPPTPPPGVPPGAVVPIELPPSQIIDGPAPDEATEPEVPETPLEGLSAESADAKADAEEQAEADASWAAIQEQRRQAVNAVEAPIVDRLNAEGAARARAETRRIEDERAAYERSLVAAEEQGRRLRAEHDAEMAAYAQRVAREQAEYRARVAACLDGDRRACRSDGER